MRSFAAGGGGGGGGICGRRDWCSAGRWDSDPDSDSGWVILDVKSDDAAFLVVVVVTVVNLDEVSASLLVVVGIRVLADLSILSSISSEPVTKSSAFTSSLSFFRRT